MKKKNIFWGLTFIFVAITLIANIAGFYLSSNVLRTAWTIVLAAWAINELIKFNLVSAALPIAIGIHINASLLGIENHIGLIYLSSFLLAMGLSMLFPKKKYFRKKVVIHANSSGEYVDAESDYERVVDPKGERVKFENNFGDNARYIYAENLTNAQIENNFGASKIYFDQTRFNPNGCDIFVECNFGKITLFIPRTVNTQVNIETTLGSVNGADSMFLDSSYPTLFISGSCAFGEIEIIYI